MRVSDRPTPISLSICTLAALTACGSSEEERPPPAYPFATFAEGQATGTGLVMGLDPTETLVSNMPESGSARYDGLVYIDPQTGGGADVAGQDVIGTMRLNVDFGDGDVDGDVTNVVREDDVALPGRLTIDNGGVTALGGGGGATAGISADLGGVLADGTPNRYLVDGIIVGTFQGDDPDALYGSFSGDVFIGNSGVVPLYSGSEGEWVAIQQ